MEAITVNYYKRYCGDYLRDTAHLSLAEHGAYCLLLDHYYSTGRALPREREALYRICHIRGASEQRAVDSVIDKFFRETADGLHNKRAELEIAHDRGRIEAARLNGKKGGRRITQKEPNGFKNKTQTEPTGLAKRNPDETH